MRSASVSLAAATSVLLLLAGCSASTEADPDVTASDAVDPAAPSDPFDPACLVGDWLITQDQLQSFYDGVAGTTEGLVFTVDGDTGLSFTADSYVYTPAFTLFLEVAGLEGQAVTTGSIGGGWTADAGIITTTILDNSLSTIVTISGVTQDASSELGGIIASDPISDAPFDCSDPDAPVLRFEVGSDARSPVALTPAS